jgi:hypothetical protein
MTLTRDRRLSLLISQDEHRMLVEISDRDGMTASDLVRQFIRHRYAELAAHETARDLGGQTRRRK